MPDDEPLDDARAVAMTLAAATAKLVETAAREARDTTNRAQDQQQTAARAEEARQFAAHYAANAQRLDELAAAEAWAAGQRPERLTQYHQERDSAYSPQGPIDTARLRAAEQKLVQDWGAAGPARPEPAYDSPQRRAAAEKAMRDAHVPDEARQAKTTADLLNGTDPRGAAATAPANATPSSGSQAAPPKNRDLSAGR